MRISTVCILLALASLAAAAPRASLPREVGESAVLTLGLAPIKTSVLAADVDGDGTIEIVVAAGEKLACLKERGKSCPGFPVVFGKGAEVVGSPLLVELSGRPAVIVPLSDGRIVSVLANGAPGPFSAKVPQGLQAGACAADLDGDGRPEIVIGAKDKRLHAFRLNGSKASGFPVELGAAATSAPSVGPLGKAKAAVVVGAEDGKLYAFDGRGHALPGFPFATRFSIDGQPALGDLDGDGQNDVIFSSEDFKLYALHGDGSPLQGFPVDTGYRLYGGPALGDVEGNGVLDAVVGGGDGKVYAVDGWGLALKGFPVRCGEKINAGVALYDLGREGKLDVVAVSAEGLICAFKANGASWPGFPLSAGGAIEGTPTLAEVTPQGGGDLLVGTGAGTLVQLTVKRGKGDPNDRGWPTEGRGARRSGRYQPNPPRYTALEISPQEPETTDELTLVYHFADADGDPEPQTLIRWYRDGRELPELAGHRKVSRGLTHKGERWGFSLQAPGEGREITSPELRIVDAAPGKPEVAIEPEGGAQPMRSKGLKVVVKKAAPDADGDALKYRYSWFRDDKPVAGLTSELLPPLSVRKGERWIARVVAFDGEREGAPAAAEVVVGNSPPGPAEISLSPSNPQAADEIKAVISRPAKDPDEEVLSSHYRWSVDGLPRGYALSVSSLAPGSVRKGQKVAVEVRPFDGEAEGPAAKAEVAVVNTPPLAPRVAIEPAKPRTQDKLVAAVVTEAADADNDRLSYRFSWLRNGKPLEGASREVSPEQTTKGQRFELRVKAFDGETEGQSGTAEVLIANTPPTRPAIALSVERPLTGEAVEVKVLKPSEDADGDKITLEYAWELSEGAGVPFKPAGLPKDARALRAGLIKKHQRYRVRVIPHDPDEAGPFAQAELEVQSSAPEAAKIAFEPAQPSAKTGLKVALVSPARDRDGDQITYRYQWSRDGERLALPAETSSLEPGKIKQGEQYRVVVIPFDGEVEGERSEIQVRIQNSAPTAPVVAIEPQKPTVKDGLSCAIRTPAQDADQDPLQLTFTWTRDGEPLPFGPSQDKVPPGSLRHGEKWACRLVASDGQASSAEAKAEVVVSNSPPSAPEVAIEPAEPGTDDDLRCALSRDSEDPDGDRVRYEFRWTVDGKRFSGTDSKEPGRVPAQATRKGQRWRCEVTPSDGMVNGAFASAEKVIGNTPPGKARVRVVPDDPAVGAKLACEVIQAAVDPDGDSVHYKYGWTKNGDEQSFAASSTEVPSRLVKAGDAWRCFVRATDGQGDGPRSESSDATIGAPPASSRR